jgi:hypothetical protein
MVGVEFVTRRIAPLQDHCHPIWMHRGGDDIRLHASELNADARDEVIRVFFSSLGSRDTSHAMDRILKFNAWEWSNAWSYPECPGSNLGARLCSERGRPRGLRRS